MGHVIDSGRRLHIYENAAEVGKGADLIWRNRRSALLVDGFPRWNHLVVRSRRGQ